MKREKYYQGRIDRLKEQLSEAAATNRELKKENNALKRKVASFEKREDALNQLTEELKNTVKDAQKEVDKAKELTHDALKAKARAERQLNIFMKDLEKQNERLAKMEHMDGMGI